MLGVRLLHECGLYMSLYGRFFISQSGLTISRQVSKIGERFQRKLENLRNNYAFKNLHLSTFPRASLGEFNVALCRNQFLGLVSLDKSVNEKPRQ